MGFRINTALIVASLLGIVGLASTPVFATPDGVNSAGAVLPIGAGGNTVLNVNNNYVTDFLNGSGGTTFSINGNDGRISSGDQISGGSGGMWVGPGQFVGSIGPTALGFWNGSQWRMAIYNSGFVDLWNGGTMRISPYPNFGSMPLTSTPSGWGMGLWTWDVFAEGTVGVGYNSTLMAYLDRNGRMYASDSVNIGGQVMDANVAKMAVQLAAMGDCNNIVKSGGNLVCGAGSNVTSFYMETYCPKTGVHNWGCWSPYTNPFTGGFNCPGGTVDRVIYWFNASGDNHSFTLHSCTSS